jgi:phosphatidate cytidylyltransferase
MTRSGDPWGRYDPAGTPEDRPRRGRHARPEDDPGETTGSWTFPALGDDASGTTGSWAIPAAAGGLDGPTESWAFQAPAPDRSPDPPADPAVPPWPLGAVGPEVRGGWSYGRDRPGAQPDWDSGPRADAGTAASWRADPANPADLAGAAVPEAGGWGGVHGRYMSADPEPDLPPPGMGRHLEPAEPPEPPGAGGAGLPATPPGRAGRNLAAALSVGLGLGGVVLASLVLYRPAFALVVVVAVGLGCWELVGAVGKAGIHPPLVPILAGLAAMESLAWFRGAEALALAFLLTGLAIMVWRLTDGPEGYLRDTATGLFIAMYAPFLAGFAILLVHPDDGVKRIIAFIAVVVCNDTFGYATGVFLGRHPLAPTVSPKKSIEGFVGSLVGCTAFGVAYFLLAFHNAWWHGALFGLALAITSTLGDLGESMIKRDLGVKDMGTLLPGHGGLMDRLDSLLPSAAVSYLLITAFVPI